MIPTSPILAGVGALLLTGSAASTPTTAGSAPSSSFHKPMSPPPVDGTAPDATLSDDEEVEQEAALFVRIAAGDARAFRELTDTHLSRIVTFATRLLKNQAEAEDVAQETFLRAWQNAHKYQAKGRASTWLFTIAHNLAVDRLRKRGRRGEHFELDDDRDAAPASVALPGRLLEKKEKSLTIREAVMSLPERQREALTLSHEQGFGNPEIADILGISVEAVESLLARARRTLRATLSGKVSRIPT